MRKVASAATIYKFLEKKANGYKYLWQIQVLVPLVSIFTGLVCLFTGLTTPYNSTYKSSMYVKHIQPTHHISVSAN